ncbi:hypothetical protein JCM10449v2_007323 [Rhodotorula kratochvilovae]
MASSPPRSPPRSRHPSPARSQPADLASSPSSSAAELHPQPHLPAQQQQQQQHGQQHHIHPHHAHPHPPQLHPPPHWRDSPAYHHAPDLTHYLVASFVPSVVPQPEEYHAKEQARQYLEKLAHQVSPGAKLLPFGSMANGFALKNSDMDLCCFLAKDAPVRAPSELVELLGRLIEQETNFYVKMLPRARIPIIKLTMPPTPACPAGVACDIGFENRLALENTRLLLTYAMVDSRLRTLVLFLKVWTKRRKINNPYRGTLSSYGYVLLVIHFLAHVKQPPVLPNLQRLALPNASALEELTYDGHDISFFDDVEALPSVFQTQNTDSAGELLIDFFRYWSKDFNYVHQVVSIRSEKGTLPKVQKGWHTDFEFDPEVIVRDQHKLCIEDPFQLDYNVARTVTRDGLYTIRGEFMRAFRILTTTPPSRPATPTPPAAGGAAAAASEENVGTLIAALCEEREDYLLIHPADADLHPAYLHSVPHHAHTPHYAPPQQQQQRMHAAAAPGPKSPRRRSAPSPRLAPQPHAPLHAQPQHPPPLWAAANGAAVHLSSAPRPQVQAQAPREAPREEPPPREQREQLGEPFALALERRSSWDGAAGGAGPPPPAAASSSAANGNGAGVDLHRFFQNQHPVAASSRSDVGGPSAAANALAQPRPSVSLTAPSSPDMAASSAYFAGHPPAPGPAAGSAYGYARAGFARPYGAAAGGSHVGPRLQSLPRQLPAHHGAAGAGAFVNPYAAPPTPLPFSPPAPPPVARTAAATAPKPIFPPEDRAAIALSSHIAFGSFPEMLPLPSYAHYHASGGSAAYLAGAGGWGRRPYGVGPSAGGRGSGSGSASAGEESDEEDGEAARGRSDEAERARRARGRSAPQIRTGPDGRETLLFGAIEVTLPRAEEVEEAEREVDDDEEEGEGAAEEDPREEDEALEREVERAGAPLEPPSASSSDDDDDDDAAERATASLGPDSSPSVPLDTAHIPPYAQAHIPVPPLVPAPAPPSVPVLTTQPPTPAKPPPRPRSSSPPSSPPMHAVDPSTPLAPPLELGSAQEAGAEAQRTPRAASPPSPQPEVNGRASPPASPQALVNGLAALHVGGDDVEDALGEPQEEDDVPPRRSTDSSSPAEQP